MSYETKYIIINQPLETTETSVTYYILLNVHGVGFTGQAGAIRHGISRALLQADPEYRTSLKREGFLTRDSRMTERKNTVFVQHVVHHNSQNVNRFVDIPTFPRVSWFKLVQINNKYYKALNRFKASASCWCFFSCAQHGRNL